MLIRMGSCLLRRPSAMVCRIGVDPRYVICSISQIDTGTRFSFTDCLRTVKAGTVKAGTVKAMSRHCAGCAVHTRVYERIDLRLFCSCSKYDKLTIVLIICAEEATGDSLVMTQIKTLLRKKRRRGLNDKGSKGWDHSVSSPARSVERKERLKNEVRTGHICGSPAMQ